MAKFYGIIGFVETEETSEGVWDPVYTEKSYYGDVIRNTKRSQSSGTFNDDLTINNVISIIADPYAAEKFPMMKYVNWMGVSWKITEVEFQYPRLILTIGGVYNGNKN